MWGVMAEKKGREVRGSYNLCTPRWWPGCRASATARALSLSLSLSLSLYLSLTLSLSHTHTHTQMVDGVQCVSRRDILMRTFPELSGAGCWV